jgi:hypothetical protein
MGKLIFSPDIDSLWQAMLTDLNTESGSFYIDVAMDCMHAVCDGVISGKWGHRYF